MRSMKATPLSSTRMETSQRQKTACTELSSTIAELYYSTHYQSQKPISPTATRSSGILMKNTIIDELNNTGYVYRDNEDGTFDVCYDHDQDANFTGVNMFHVATVKEEGDLWCVNGNEGAGWGEYPKEDWTLERAIYDQCIDENI